MKSTNGLANLISAFESGNGATWAIALYKAGVDITKIGCVRNADNISYKACATIVRDSMGQDTQETILRKMAIEESCADMFTIAWQQGQDNGLKNVQGDKALTRYALDMVSQHREKLVTGKSPRKASKSAIEQIAESTPAKVQPYNPAVKPTDTIIGCEFKVGKGTYKVISMSGDVIRVHLMTGQAAIHGAESEFAINGKQYVVTRLINDSTAKFFAKPVAESVKPIAKTRKAKIQPTTPATPADSQSELIAKVTAAVIAALAAQ